LILSSGEQNHGIAGAIDPVSLRGGVLTYILNIPAHHGTYMMNNHRDYHITVAV
jgi:hypothetical protein